ncbi:hypothetical protein CDV36_011662 [Fusarium kuroshium]|uniref:Uncharacterized protein n=1 Tax=Fusarium kuroshium TaxID=2010991 RepID=A0A3M2RTZ0_9HYPO|nr:hypothetical protein CDV36_011662 [Fusarium kuroshium]
MEMLCATRTLQVWKAVPTLIPRSLTSRRDPSVLNPLTAEQLDSRADEFVKAIDLEAVRALASSYNDGSPCRIDEMATARGSFDICFFVKFDARAWAVRIRHAGYSRRLGEAPERSVHDAVNPYTLRPYPPAH